MALLRSPLPVWMALFTNVFAFSGLPTLLPILTTVGQLVTQGAPSPSVMCITIVRRCGQVNSARTGTPHVRLSRNVTFTTST
jgi:hypothetical protein